jgi:guanine deaminase
MRGVYMITPEPFALRGQAAFLRRDPFLAAPGEALGWESDARLVVRHGRIEAFGPAAHTLLPAGVPETPLGHRVVLPGLIDCHVHYPQLGVMGAMGHSLLPWLERYTFPAERELADPTVVHALARHFVAELARNGTTTAAVYGSVHAHSADALFEAAQGSGLQLIAGKSLMDRNAPPGLPDDARGGCAETEALIGRWHGRGRFGCAVTVRFLGTSSPAQIEAAADLWRRHPGTWLQSHLAEDRDELALIARLFPDARDYTDAFDRFGLLGRRAVFGHGIHLSDRERARLAEAGAALAHCPTSNLFLGSGLFDAAAARAAGVAVGLASDVGAGGHHPVHAGHHGRGLPGGAAARRAALARVPVVAGHRRRGAGPGHDWAHRQSCRRARCRCGGARSPGDAAARPAQRACPGRRGAAQGAHDLRR